MSMPVPASDAAAMQPMPHRTANPVQPTRRDGRDACCRLNISKNGAQGRNRTTDTVIFSHVLYQLSYLGTASAGL